MTYCLPPNLLALFAPREPIPYLPPLDHLPHEKKTHGYSGVGTFTQFFENPKDTPPPTRFETREERLERKHREKAEQAVYKLEQDIALWDPLTNGNSTSDPYKTLFIARINYDTSESKLQREFEVYGTVKKIQMIHDVKTGKPRGYAFIEYEHERDMHSAYKHADGKKIDGRRILVDVERARTVKGWLPRRLGGGLGGTRRGGSEVNVTHTGREETRVDDARSAANGAGERVERDRERGERRRSRSRERRRQPRGRQEEVPTRDRRRDHRRRSRGRSRDKEPEEKRERRRSRSRDREPEEANESMKEEKRERKRSRSRDRNRKRSRRSRSRSPRDRNRDRKSKRDRRDRGDHEERNAMIPADQIKVEEEDNYSNGPQTAGDMNSEDNSMDAYGNSQNGEYNAEDENSKNVSSNEGYNEDTSMMYPGMMEPFKIKQEPVDEEEET